MTSKKTPNSSDECTGIAIGSCETVFGRNVTTTVTLKRRVLLIPVKAPLEHFNSLRFVMKQFQVDCYVAFADVFNR